MARGTPIRHADRRRFLAGALALTALLVAAGFLLSRPGRRGPHEVASEPHSSGADRPESELELSQVVDEIDAREPPRRTGLSLTVHVEADGDGLVGAIVTLERDGAEPRRAALPPELDVTFDGLAAGTYVASVEDTEAYWGGEVELAVLDGPPSVATLHLLRRRHIPVRVVDPTGARFALKKWWSSSPIQFAFRVSTEPPGPARSIVPGEAAGPPPPGTVEGGVLKLRARPPAYVSLLLGECVVDSVLVRGSEKEVVFVVTSDVIDALFATLELRVVDGATGEPLGDRRGCGFGPARFTGPWILQATDPEGRCRKVVPPGRVKVLIQIDPYAFVERILTLLPGEHRDLGDVALEPAIVIVGMVTDELGDPVSITPLVFDADDLLQPLGAASNGGTPGWFGIVGLPPRPLLVALPGDEWAASPLLVRPGDADLRSLKLIARRGARVNLDPGARAGGVVMVRDERGAAVWAGRIERGVDCALRLLPGSYEARVDGAAAASFSVVDRDLRVALVE